MTVTFLPVYASVAVFVDVGLLTSAEVDVGLETSAEVEVEFRRRLTFRGFAVIVRTR